MPKVSITISTYCRVDLLCEILCALNEQSADSSTYEVIVCDSNSTDGTFDMIESMRKKVKYSLLHVHTKNNLAAKRNIGILNSSHPLVVFLDDDCLPDKNFVERHLVNFRRVGLGKPVVFCGEVRYPSDFVAKSNYYRFRDSRHFGYSKGSTVPDRLDYKTIVVMNMCFEKDLFVQLVGHVNEAFVGYGAEDQDLGWRLQKAGYSILPCDALISHYEMTGSIRAYGSKIRRSSRDGMRTLMMVNPEAAFGIEKLRKLDPCFPNRTLLDVFILKAIQIFMVCRMHVLLEEALDITDSVKLFYFPKLYRLLMGIYYIEGSRQRQAALTPERAEFGWDG